MFLITFIFNSCNLNANEGNPGNEMTDGQVNKLTAEMFRKVVWDYKSNPKEWIYKGDQPCIIDFYADWCRPCKMVAPIMDELSKEYKGKVRIYKVNTDEQRELSALFNISSIPAVMFIPKNGKPQMSVGAMQKPGYVDLIHSVLVVK